MIENRQARTAEIFHRALSQQPELQISFLREACDGDTDLLQRVKDLLDSYDEVRTIEPISTKAATQLVDAEMLVALSERYAEIKLIGCGGMGVVMRARDRELDKIVALKILHPAFADDERAVERFRNEIRLAHEITHQNVCRTYGLERVSGKILISMEYVEGETLRAILDRVKGVSVPEGISWTEDICAGLAAAHEKGIVHRDLKPENIMIDRAGRTKLMDFGIARFIDGPAGTTATVIGTPSYMSPEQAMGKPVGSASDIYSLGLVLFEIFTGVQPPDRPGLQPSQVNPYLPAQIDRAIRKCLFDDPRERFQSAKELSSALRAMPTGKPRRMRRTLVVALSTFLILAIGLGVIWWRSVPRSPLMPRSIAQPPVPAQSRPEVAATKEVPGTSNTTSTPSKIPSQSPTIASTQEQHKTVQGTWFVRISGAKGSSYFNVELLEYSAGNVAGKVLSPFQGTITGRVKSGVLTFELTESFATCSGSFKGTATISTNKGNGTYTGSDCNGDHGKGTVLMSKWSPTALAEHEEMRKQKLLDYFSFKLLTWTEEDARLVMGEELLHRYGYDDAHNLISDIYTFPDPTMTSDRIELAFDIKTKRLTNAYVYPLGIFKWDDAKKLWGDNVTIKENPDGSKFYMYNDRALNLFVDKNGKVLSLGIYKRM